ncbi:ABC transporter permease [Clostridium ganghwense]|uniref:ABC transporter permease n=1 Tax=Clostridium ganghwense TaxID=312089 RepID=A0ABT4CKR4_9CLOT|nr:FtsX-like permease family protein [Clostridium ganghwense]MCY6369636.1 ABC transporter permease [Clostridium ganghwense]
MNSIDLLRMGLKNLFRRKLRTFLTTLGIIIGTVSIVVTVSLGVGLKEFSRKQVMQWGNINVIDVRPQYRRGMMSGGNRGEDRNLLKKADFDKIKKIRDVELICPIMNVNAKLISGRYSAQVNICGVKPEYMDKLGYKIEEGRLLRGGDKLNLVFGNKAALRFVKEGASENYDYYPRDGKEMKPKVKVLKDKMLLSFDPDYGRKKTFAEQMEEQADEQTRQKKVIPPHKIKGVGVLKEDFSYDYSVFMSIDELKKLKEDYDKKVDSRSKKIKGYESAKVKIKDVNKVKEAQQKIKDMGYEAYSLVDQLSYIEKTTNIIQMVLGGIGAISLLVAAIGITNTMVMAIYERRKEIGVMKVIGASLKDIKKLFLFEATMIGLLGGTFGLIVSFLLSQGINVVGKSFMQSQGQLPEGTALSVIPLWLALGALGFTTIIGLISGYLPARKAMKLSALEAIKTE